MAEFKPQFSEHDIQSSFFNYIEFVKGTCPILNLFYAIPNGVFIPGDRKRASKIMNKMKAEGLKPSMPDTCLPTFSYDKRYCALYIEFKKPGGRLEPGQRLIHQELLRAGNNVQVAESLDQAINITSNYLKIKLPLPR